MGSELLILATVEDRRLIGRAVHELERLETLWTRFSPTSDISRINNSGGGNVPVAAETTALVSRMIDGWRTSGGAFNPTILAQLVDDGYASSRVDPTRSTVLPTHRLGIRPMSEVTVSETNSSVTVPAGFAIDPGGIGKGFGADLVVAWLIENGATGALVSIGGDLSMAGSSPDPQGWLVDVEHADPADGILCSLALNNAGIATSNVSSRRWGQGAHEHHHILDPRTGRASRTDLVAVTVVAPTGWQAEVLAKTGLLAGSDGVIDELEKRGAEGLAITTAGDILRTYEFADVELRPKAGAA